MPSQSDETHPRPLHVMEIIGNAIVGGMEHYVRNLVRHLPREQFRITCLCPFESPFTRTLREANCDVFITPVTDDPAWRSIQLAVELIRQQSIDLIHAHMPKAHALAGLASCLTNKPAVATVHGMHVTAQELGISLTTGTHLVVVCQDAYAQALTLGVPPERVTLIPNGVDIEMFVPNCKRERLRNALNIALDTALVGFVGRIDHDKGPDVFLRVAELVHRQRGDAQFVLVGEGELDGSIAAQIVQAGSGAYVRMAGMWPETQDVYPALDLLVSTSRSEGMPLALLEGMACGVPIVAMGIGGVPEVVEYGATGYVTPAGDVERTGNAIVKLLNEPERRQQMALAARQRALEHFDLRQSARFTSELFRRIVKETSTTPLYVTTRTPTRDEQVRKTA